MQEHNNNLGKPSKCPVCRKPYTPFDHSSNPTDLVEQKSWDEHFGVQGFYGVFEKDLIEAVLPNDPDLAMNTNYHFRDGAGAGAGASSIFVQTETQAKTFAKLANLDAEQMAEQIANLDDEIFQFADDSGKGAGEVDADQETGD
jgi:hypothetical protein